jgi:tetratricopeptide (TPR) repeat protein
VFQYSRRGTAGGALVFATWRDKVLAGSSFDHLMALIPIMTSQPTDLPQLLARASQLAGDNVERKIAVAQAAIRMGNHALARSIIEPLLKSSPTRELCALAASMAQTRADLPAALGYLEQAQVVGADEEVDLATVRAELRRIIGLAQQVALQASGRERANAVARAMTWGARWRAIDPGNAEIDQTLGNLLLATGDTAGAWRQLSSGIERDPWSQAGYTSVADALERQGKLDAALELWQQAIVIDQTNPTPRVRKAQALIALGRDTEGDALLEQVATQKWHDMWSGTVYQAKSLLERGPSGAKRP